MDAVLTTFEIIGILAAALSGAMLAIDKKMDLFGVVLIGMITGLGGGVMRDVTLGSIPRSFSNPSYLISAILPPLAVFLVAFLLQQKYVREEALIDKINNVFDALGLGAFAIGGAAVARSVGYGEHFVVVVFAGLITAVGGGILRDILISRTPPAIFSRAWLLLLSVGVSLLVFFLAFFFRNAYFRWTEHVEHINNYFDAVGLAAFTVMGTEVAFSAGLSSAIVLSLTLGFLTGVGGGVMRDILVNDAPFIFKKHVYALVSLLGSALYFGLHFLFPTVAWPTVIAVLFIVLLRILATKYRWNLPRIDGGK
jgi:uncharacterized membrane protein YeiH